MMGLYRWWNHRNYMRFTEKLTGIKIDEKGLRATTISWEELKERMAAKDRWRQAHPVQAVLEHAWRRMFGRYGIIRHTLHPRRLMNQAVWFWQRGRRGWADCGVWSLDSYITRVISEMMLHLSRTTHSWPGEGSQWPTPESWDAHLLDLSERLGAWNDASFADEDAFETTRQAMIEFSTNLGMYWD
jgi:hypothetical protein